MMSFRVRGRVLAVFCSKPDSAPDELELRVTVDGHERIDVANIFSVGTASGQQQWLVHLPAALYVDTPRRLDLQSFCDDRIVARGGFWFSGSSRITNPPDSASHDSDNSALFNRTKTAIADYGTAAQAALSIERADADFIFFPIIDWHFRTQRPQHLARCIAEKGHRVFYISVHFGAFIGAGRFKVVEQCVPGVFEIQLLVSSKINHIYGGFTPDHIEQLRDAVLELYDVMQITVAIAIVQFASWCEVAEVLPGCTMIYDCLDLVSGFANVGRKVLDDENRLTANADLLVTTSQPLADRFATRRKSSIIRNGAEIHHFRSALVSRRPDAPPVIGYFGAIDCWFEESWIRSAAEQHPHLKFRLIGHAVPEITSKLAGYSNIELVGEIEYAKLPEAISNFCVGIIPFKITSLIECVNPVKLYEYFAAGLPVVSSPLPEVLAATDMVHIASTASEFSASLLRALDETSDTTLTKRRVQWAMGHSWVSRASELANQISKIWPRVSVIIVAYNNAQLTASAVRSVLALSDYDELEIIVVDNGSADDTHLVLSQFSAHECFRMIRLDENVGFAAGNNVGLKAATGDVFVLLNNDVYVTRGWVRDLIRPLLLDSTIGLVGPLTNAIGNEQQVQIAYSNLKAMAMEARRVTRRYPRRLFEVLSVAFFGVAFRRDVYSIVGGLDEAFGIGFFEDDDYCMRVRKAGYRVVVADNVFIHHQLSASFADFGEERRRKLMEHNRKVFEEKWGPWQAHKYRDEPGFGT
jgi:GT2 family glycosyltransferase/glycosyltransferase involved in cell wall biosynthesis